jgi:branched-chain amino acid aminotransferase
MFAYSLPLSFKMKSKILFLDNQYVKASAALKEQLLPWNLPGIGLFETLRIFKGKAVLTEKHIDRMLKGLDKLNIKHRVTFKKVTAWLTATVQKNNMAEGRMRICVWNDGKSHISIAVEEHMPLPDDKYAKGFYVKSFSMGDEQPALTTGIKTIKYGSFLDLYHQAQNFGCDEAVLLNQQGCVVEGSRSNIFWVSKGALYTPALKTGCLNGVTRDAVMSLAEKLNIKVRLINAGLDPLIRSEEAFLTNSLMGIMSLTRVDEKQIGSGSPGATTLQLQHSYIQEVLEK